MNKTFPIGMRAVHQKDLTTAILEAKERGFDFIEIHFSSPQFLPQNYTKEQLKEINLLARKNGIALQTHSEIGQSMILTDNLLRDAEKRKLKRMITFSTTIGATRLTLHPGKASAYYSGPGKSVSNEELYTKYYSSLFEDSLVHLSTIAPKNFYICIENTDNFNTVYQKILSKYLKKGSIYLTWDIMKSFSSFSPLKMYEDRVGFLKKHSKYIKNIHISGPSHGELEGNEYEFKPFLDFLKGKDIPIVIEIIPGDQAMSAKNTLREMGY